ncbi:MAG: hypothetical protein AAGD25_03485 [Cyanobacteria bacterium P01_F01_bin.150]
MSESSSEQQSSDISQLPNAKTVAPPQEPNQTQMSAGNTVLSFLSSVFTVIFRLGLLTVGSGLALVVGMAIATIRPAEVTDEPPLLETVVQQFDRIRSYKIKP